MISDDIIDNKKIKRIREYYEHYYANDFNNIKPVEFVKDTFVNTNIRKHRKSVGSLL